MGIFGLKKCHLATLVSGRSEQKLEQAFLRHFSKKNFSSFSSLL
jgi:hypothetical protein